MAKVWDSELVEIMARHYGLAPPTHGEKWLAKAYKRLEGWCATDDWAEVLAFIESHRGSRHEPG